MVPMGKLRATGGIHTAPQPHQSMGSRTHGAMLTGGVYRGSVALFRGEILGSPPSNGKFRMPGVISTRIPLASGKSFLTLCIDQQCAEWFVTVFHRLPRQIDAPPQILTIIFCWLCNARHDLIQPWAPT